MDTDEDSCNDLVIGLLSIFGVVRDAVLGLETDVESDVEAVATMDLDIKDFALVPCSLVLVLAEVAVGLGDPGFLAVVDGLGPGAVEDPDLGPEEGLDLAEVVAARPRADDGGCLATPDIFCVNSEVLRQKRLIYIN